VRGCRPLRRLRAPPHPAVLSPPRKWERCWYSYQPTASRTQDLMLSNSVSLSIALCHARITFAFLLFHRGSVHEDRSEEHGDIRMKARFRAAVGRCRYSAILALTTGLGAATAASGAQPGSRVVDSAGKVLGNLSGQDIVERNVNGTWVGISPVTPQGFQTYPDSVILLYTTSNCTGQAYMEADELPVTGELFGSINGAVATSATLYYPAPPYSPAPAFNSQGTFTGPNNAMQCCTSMGATVSCGYIPVVGSGLYGPAKTENLDFTPPFTVK
jgi:hypothetical protein